MKEYKPGQRVFVLDNKTLFKGRISKSKDYKENGRYLVVDLRIYNDKEDIYGLYEYGHYFHSDNIVSFSDKKDFSIFTNKYLQILIDRTNKIDKTIKSLYAERNDIFEEYSDIDSLVFLCL